MTITKPTTGRDDLSALGSDELVRVWRRSLADKVPDHLPRSLLARLLAHRLQVDRHGGLSRKASAYLERMEVDLAAGRVPRTPQIETRQLKAGCQLVREHGGTLHRVMVKEGGYAWNGQTFESLSAVARAITGTNWNGRRFFGLKDRPKAQAGSSP